MIPKEIATQSDNNMSVEIYFHTVQTMFAHGFRLCRLSTNYVGYFPITYGDMMNQHFC